MYNKVFKIGYTKRKKIPVLVRNISERFEGWCDIFLLASHLFDATMRDSKDNKLSTLLFIYSSRNINNQHCGDYGEVIIKTFYPKKQVIITNNLFIVIKELRPYNLGKYTEKWLSSHFPKLKDKDGNIL